MCPYQVLNNVSLSGIYFQNLLKCPFSGKIGKSENREIFKKHEKCQCSHVFIIKIHILAKFHEKIMIFDEIRGHLVISPFYRAQTRNSEGPLRTKVLKFEVEVLDTLNFHRTCLIG